MRIATFRSFSDPDSKSLWVGMTALVIILLAFMFVFRPEPSPRPDLQPPISRSVLEQEHGLRVTLVAVTAAGGMVDVRLKMMDGAKVQELLQDQANYPSLWLPDRQLMLQVSEETRSQQLKFEDGGDIFLLFPNSGGAVRPGTPVTLVFGDTPVEPIEAR